MKRLVDFTPDEILAMEKLAKVSKMDCWFGINDNNQIIDYENKSKVCPSQGGAVKDLLDGATDADFANLTPNELVQLIQILLRSSD